MKAEIWLSKEYPKGILKSGDKSIYYFIAGFYPSFCLCYNNHMDKKLTQELKEKLEQQKTAVEEQLKTFADKDPNLKGDWDSKFPKFNGEFGGAALESAADEVEEYETRLPVEHSLEIRLQNINSALEKIGGDKYGKCENCGKEIGEDRLRVSPEARFCMNCAPR